MSRQPLTLLHRLCTMLKRKSIQWEGKRKLIVQDKVMTEVSSIFKNIDVHYTFYEKAELHDPWTTLWVEDAISINNENATEWAAVIKHIVKVDSKVFLIIQSFSDVDYCEAIKPLYRAGLTPSILEKDLQAITPSSVNRIIWYTHACQVEGNNKCQVLISRLCKHGKASCEVRNCPVGKRYSWSHADMNYW